MRVLVLVACLAFWFSPMPLQAGVVTGVPSGFSNVRCHRASFTLDPRTGRLTVDDEVEVAHPGGPDAVLAVALPAGAADVAVRWRTTPLAVEGDQGEVRVGLPYAPGPEATRVRIRYRCVVEGGEGPVVVEDLAAFLPRGGAPAPWSAALRLPPGYDLVGARAPRDRSPRSDGGLVVRIADVPAGETCPVAVGRWVVETRPVAGGVVEVAEADPAVASALAGLLADAVGRLPAAGVGCTGSLSLAVAPLLRVRRWPGLSLRSSESGRLRASEAARACYELLWGSVGTWGGTERDDCTLVGLADYCAAAARVGRRGADGFQRLLEKTGKTLRESRPVPAWRRWRGKSVPARERGFALVYMLRGLAGGEGLGRILAALAGTARKGGTVGAEELAAATAQVLGYRPGWLFDAFLTEGFLPDLVVDRISVDEQHRPVELLYDEHGTPSDAGRYVTEVRLLQTGEMAFKGRVGLRVATDVEKCDTDVILDGRQTTVRLLTARPPRSVTVDPNGWFIETDEKNNTLALPGAGRL